MLGAGARRAGQQYPVHGLAARLLYSALLVHLPACLLPLLPAVCLAVFILQASLEALHTPAIMLFLHFLPGATTLWLLSAQGVLELRPLSLRAVQGSLVAALLAGLQV